MVAHSIWLWQDRQIMIFYACDRAFSLTRSHSFERGRPRLTFEAFERVRTRQWVRMLVKIKHFCRDTQTTDILDNVQHDVV